MLTVEEIRHAEFTKLLGGYKMSEVDEFIDRCADTVEALQREKDEMSKKMEVLADKLVEYRNDEDNIRAALLSAQKLGDTVVREANHKAGLIMDDARIKAEKIQETARREISAEQEELARVKQEVNHFKERLVAIYREHITLVNLIPGLDKDTSKDDLLQSEQKVEPEAPASAETAEEPVAETTEPEAVVEPAISLNEAAVPAEEPVVQLTDVAGEEVPEQPHNKFANLQFGDAYTSASSEFERKFAKRKK